MDDSTRPKEAWEATPADGNPKQAWEDTPAVDTPKQAWGDTTAGGNPEVQATDNPSDQEPATHQVVNPYEHAELFEDWYQKKLRLHASLLVTSDGGTKLNGIVSKLHYYHLLYNCSDHGAIDWYRRDLSRLRTHCRLGI